MLVWHVIQLPDSHCCPHCSLSLKDIHAGLQHRELLSCRHILQSCSGPDVGVDSSRSDKDCTDTGDPTPHSDHVHDSGPSLSDTNSRETSLDSDMLSISDISDEASTGPSDPGAGVLPVFDTVVCRLVSEYRQAAGLASGSKSTGAFAITSAGSSPLHTQLAGGVVPTSGGNGSTTKQPNGSPSQNGARLGKRKRPEDDDGDDDGDDRDDNSMPPPKTRKFRPLETRSSSLACPFWKHDPFKYADCSRNKLYKISRVKQHIDRKHSPQFYCECCLAVFPDEARHGNHVRSGNCAWDPTARLDGITHQQRRQLSRKSKPGLSEPERWFVIWDVVLPGQRRPASPYIDADLSMDLYQFQAFTHMHGPAVLLEELRASRVSSWSEDVEMTDMLQTVLARGLNRIHEDWLTNRSALAGQTTTRRSTPSSSPVDSGVGLHSGTLTQSSEQIPGGSSESRSEPSSSQQDARLALASDQQGYYDGDFYLLTGNNIATGYGEDFSVNGGRISEQPVDAAPGAHHLQFPQVDLPPLDPDWFDFTGTCFPPTSSG